MEHDWNKWKAGTFEADRLKRIIRKGKIIRRTGSKNRFVLLLLITLATLSISSCATMQRAYHEYIMRGSIVETSNSDVYLCIGSKDGAAVGQELSVYKVISYHAKGPVALKREYTGKVRITEIVDEHFAKAKVISGRAEKNFIVELERPST